MDAERVKSKHKCVFFLGAGFSRDAGVPLQKELLPMFLSNPHSDQKRKERVLKFLSEVFSFTYTKLMGDNYDDNIYSNLEDVFSLLDTAIGEHSYLGKFCPSDLRDIREEFVAAILGVIDRSVRDANYIKRFAEVLSNQRIESDSDDPFSIITTNWDIVLLNAFRQYHDRIIKDYLEKNSLSNIREVIYTDRKTIALLDYCIYTEPLRDAEDHIPSVKIKCMGYKNIKLLNLHGSPIWLICQKCKKIFGPPAYSRLGLYKKDALPAINGSPSTCPLCAESEYTLRPILIMPTYRKIIENVHLSAVWQNAAIELQEADRLFFVGYSLPEADYLIRYLLVSNIKRNAKIFVSALDNDVAETKQNYEKLFGSRIQEVRLLVGSGKMVVEDLCNRIEEGKIECFMEEYI